MIWCPAFFRSESTLTSSSTWRMFSRPVACARVEVPTLTTIFIASNPFIQLGNRRTGPFPCPPWLRLPLIFSPIPASFHRRPAPRPWRRPADRPFPAPAPLGWCCPRGSTPRPSGHREMCIRDSVTGPGMAGRARLLCKGRNQNSGEDLCLPRPGQRLISLFSVRPRR